MSRGQGQSTLGKLLLPSGLSKEEQGKYVAIQRLTEESL